MRPIDVMPTARQIQAGVGPTTTPTVPDDREIFKVTHHILISNFMISIFLFRLLFFIV